MRRRILLTVVGVGQLSLAGCTAMTRLMGGEDLPEACPTSQDLGVEWPRDVNESTVASFLKECELAYYQQEVFEAVFEPQSRLDTYGGWIGRVSDVTETNGGGWRGQFEGIVGIERAGLRLEAIPSVPPVDTEIVPGSEIDDEQLTEVLDEAVEMGQAAHEIGAGQTDEYLDIFETISHGFELTRAEDSDTFYIDVDGTTVKLVVKGFPYHADHEWNAWYYVDEQVVRRSAAEDVDPRDGQLLECRTSN